MKFYVEYETGAGNFTVETENLDEVMEKADYEAAYTQRNIVIYSEDKDVWMRFWSSIPWDEDSGFEYNEIIDFGKFGYYTPWEYQF